MEQNKKWWQRVNKILTWLCILTSLLAAVYFIATMQSYYIFKSVSATAICVFFRCVCNRFGLHKYYKAEFFALVYLYLVCAVGLALDVYNRVMYFDKFAHFLSGFALAFVGVLLHGYYASKHHTLKNEFWLLAVLVNGVSATLSIAWEIFEFVGFIGFGVDAQHHLTTGVMDTMGDLITCILGTLIVTVVLFVQYKKGKLPLLFDAIEEIVLRIKDGFKPKPAKNQSDMEDK